MNFDKYLIRNDLVNKSQIEKAVLIGFYLETVNNKSHFSISEILDVFSKSNFSMPNKSRLRINMSKDPRFVNKGKDLFAINRKDLLKLKEEIILEDNETIESSSEFIDESLFNDTRGYLIKIIKQINNCYNNNAYDACAVMVRRLLEILLIKSYQKLDIDNEIKNKGRYLMLENIVSNAVENTTLNLSRDKQRLNNIRNVGNFSAHKIEYNARKCDLDKIQEPVRVLTEELLYKSGLKN